MDQVGLPIVLAWQLDRARPKRLAPRPRRGRLHRRRRPEEPSRSAGRTRRATRPRRSPPRSPGWSARPTSRAATATRSAPPTYERKADSWQRNVERWTATTNGPYAPQAVLPAHHQGPQAGQGHDVRDRRLRPSKIDQRRVVDVSFLELVRLGVKRPDDPAIVNTLRVVDSQARGGRRSGTASPSTATASAATASPGVCSTTTRAGRSAARGRSSPASAASTSCSRAARRTRSWQAMASAANGGGMLPEQVWDGREPDR